MGIINVYSHPKPNVHRKIQEIKKAFHMENQEENITTSRGKLWEKIDEVYTEGKHKDRKEAVAEFRLMSGHDCLGHHLHR